MTINNIYHFNFRESDRDVVAAASSILIVSSVKVAKQTLELIKSELHHQLPDQRINALLRFQVIAFVNGLLCDLGCGVFTNVIFIRRFQLADH